MANGLRHVLRAAAGLAGTHGQQAVAATALEAAQAQQTALPGPGVLWALLRDGRVFTSAPPVAQAA
jgi:hypothetical protein